MTRERNKALFYLIITSILWSIGGLFIKLIPWSPISIAGIRSGIAAIVMLVYVRNPTKIFNKFNILGALTYASLLIFFVSANKLTTSANAILLQFTAPIWVLLFSKLFLRETFKRYDYITVIIVMLGMILFFVGDIKSGYLIGNLIAVLSGVSMAGVVIFLKLQKEGSPVEITLLGNIITFIIALPFFKISPITINSVICIAILGIFQLGISYILYTNAIKHVTSIEAILIPILEPLLNPVWVLIFTGEAPSKYALIGGLIVLFSITLREIYILEK